MRGGISGGRTRLATALGIVLAVGALLALTLVPAATSAVPTQRPDILTAAKPTCFTGDGPEYAGYDTANRYVYVPNFYSGNITVFSGTCDVVGSIPLRSGAEPVQAIFDPQDNYVFVTDFGLDQVYEISGTKVVGTITGLDGPWGVTYQPSSTCTGGPLCSTLLVANEASDTVAIIDLPALEDTGSISVGPDPQALAVDPETDQLWVANSGSDTVSVVTLPEPGVPIGDWYSVTTLPVGADPRGVDIDLANGDAYIANFGSNNVTVYYASGLTSGPYVDGSISGIKEPVDVAWDQTTGDIYVTSLSADKVWLLGGSSGLSVVKKETMSVAGVNGICYDAAIGEMYVTGFDDGYVEVTS